MMRKKKKDFTKTTRVTIYQDCLIKIPPDPRHHQFHNSKDKSSTAQIFLPSFDRAVNRKENKNKLK